MNTDIINKIKQGLKAINENEPIIVFSPGRINLIGEHTDYNKGFALPAAIDKGIYLAIQKNEKQYFSITALDNSETIEMTFNDLKPIKNGGWKNYLLGTIAGILNTGVTLEYFDAVFKGDIPIGAGLSSSAALENSLVFALNELLELNLSKAIMIKISQQAEHKFVGVKCGIMDQYVSMFGESDHALLLDCKSVSHKKIPVDFNNYEIILINSNVKHSLINTVYNQRRSACYSVANIMHVDSLRELSKKELFLASHKIPRDKYLKVLYVLNENQRVLNATMSLQQKNLEDFGNLLYKSHSEISSRYNVSCTEIDYLVSQTNNYEQILGSRMMGGGFGGCTINLVKKQSDVIIKNIMNNYRKTFHIKPSVYKVKISDGVKRLKMYEI